MDRAEFLSMMAAMAAGAVVGCESESEDGTTGTSGSNSSSNATTSGATTGGGGSSASSGPSGSGGSQSGCATDVDAQITCRTGHSLIVTAADITAGIDKTYDIQGTNQTHGHMVTVTAAMFAQLLSGETVEIMVPSSIQPHTVYISCEGLDPHALDDQNCN